MNKTSNNHDHKQDNINTGNNHSHGDHHQDRTKHDNAHDHGDHHLDHATHDNAHDHGDHSGLGHAHHLGNIKQRFLVSLFLAIPILFLAPFMGRTLFFQFSFPGSDWLVLIFATLLFFYGGMPFLRGAKMELQTHSPAMMTLISLGITTSYVYSLYAFIANNILHSRIHVMDFFWELASLILIMLLGHWIENNAIESAGNALQRMAELLPGTATVIDEHGNAGDIDLKEVLIGDHILVRAGDKIPTDGIVIEGKTTVNESLLTGEAKAVTKNLHDQVIGGSVNGLGTITIKVTGTGESGFLAQVMELVSTAQREKSHIETLSDKVAKWLFFVAVFVGVISFAVWLVITDLSLAVERMVTVFVIACPHALGLAVPLVTARSTSLGAQNGLLVKKRQALEAAQKVDIVMMDKTGTLTEGDFTVNAFYSYSDNYSDEEVLSLMAALEKSSTHPLAAGILDKAAELELPISDTFNVNNI
ncbi:MAG TPA: HAD-IC family P-type ATPase, partial [Clostridiaceae bacterium]|nr:HAD-IC family P-type ATPase [Clostridiaceae bacterium]